MRPFRSVSVPFWESSLGESAWGLPTVSQYVFGRTHRTKKRSIKKDSGSPGSFKRTPTGKVVFHVAGRTCGSGKPLAAPPATQSLGTAITIFTECNLAGCLLRRHLALQLVCGAAFPLKIDLRGGPRLSRGVPGGRLLPKINRKPAQNNFSQTAFKYSSGESKSLHLRCKRTPLPHTDATHCSAMDCTHVALCREQSDWRGTLSDLNFS